MDGLTGRCNSILCVCLEFQKIRRDSNQSICCNHQNSKKIDGQILWSKVSKSCGRNDKFITIMDFRVAFFNNEVCPFYIRAVWSTGWRPICERVMAPNSMPRHKGEILDLQILLAKGEPYLFNNTLALKEFNCLPFALWSSLAFLDLGRVFWLVASCPKVPLPFFKEIRNTHSNSSNKQVENYLIYFCALLRMPNPEYTEEMNLVNL